jgi:hypothetical protein
VAGGWGCNGDFLTVLSVVVYSITINVPVVFMARYVMILRGATSL